MSEAARSVCIFTGSFTVGFALTGAGFAAGWTLLAVIGIYVLALGVRR